LVLLLIAGILVAGRSIYQRYLLKKDIDVVKEDVEQLFDILDKNYFELSEDARQRCSTINNAKITNANWALILPSSLIPQTENPPHPKFIIGCENPSSDVPAQLTIRALLTVKDDKLGWYAERLGGVVDGSYVKWQKIPTFTYAGKDPLWILSGQLQQFTKKLSIDNYLALSVTQFIFPLTVTFTYSDGSSDSKKIETLTGDNSVRNKLSTGVKSINIIQGTIKCGGKLISSAGPINNIPIYDGDVRIKINLPSLSGSEIDLSDCCTIDSGSSDSHYSAVIDFVPKTRSLLFCYY